jgi:hypothetical protein
VILIKAKFTTGACSTLKYIFVNCKLNQIVVQMMQKTFMTSSNIASLLHDNIACRTITRKLSLLNISLKKLPSSVGMRVAAVTGKMSAGEAIMASLMRGSSN